MNAAYVHLLLNHFPIVGLIFSTFLLIFGIFRSNTTIVRVALSMTVVAGVFALGTFLTGEPAEEILEKLGGFSHDAIHEHEEAGEFAIWWSGLTAVFSAAGLYLLKTKNKIHKAVMAVILVSHIMTLTVLARTNYLGGKISHPELQ